MVQHALGRGYEVGGSTVLDRNGTSRPRLRTSGRAAHLLLWLAHHPRRQGCLHEKAPRLTKQGITFVNHRINSCVCRPSRSVIQENHWVVPAAWRVVVEGDKVAVWQVYVNPERMVEILNRLNAL